MWSFDLAAYVQASTEAQGVPERLCDPDTVIEVVRRIRSATRSGYPRAERPIDAHQAMPNEHLQATTA
jgi:hypothetical protein